MKKKFFFLTFFIMMFCLHSEVFAVHGSYDEYLPEELQEETQPLIIPKGSFFRCFNSQDISSEFNNNGDIVKFLIPSDFTLNNTLLVPKNSIFVGIVKNLAKAEQGRNGTFTVEIAGLIFPDGTRFAVKGAVLNEKNNKIFGGNFTRRSAYKMTVHRSYCFGKRGAMLLQQNGERIMGEETLIKMGELKTIMVEEPVTIN